MRTLIPLAIAVLLAVACGDNVTPVTPTADAGVDAPAAVLAACLERPTDLPLPPTGALLCELLPPSFTASRSR